jgi:hypothetical protein
VVAVGGQVESVAGACFEPVVHVVGHVGGGAGHDWVVVDDAVGEDVVRGPSHTQKVQPPFEMVGVVCGQL